MSRYLELVSNMVHSELAAWTCDGLGVFCWHARKLFVATVFYGRESIRTMMWILLVKSFVLETPIVIGFFEWMKWRGLI